MLLPARTSRGSQRVPHVLACTCHLHRSPDLSTSAKSSTDLPCGPGLYYAKSGADISAVREVRY
eukprot:2154229-Rhodomonas_salina.2